MARNVVLLVLRPEGGERQARLILVAGNDLRGKRRVAHAVVFALGIWIPGLAAKDGLLHLLRVHEGVGNLGRNGGEGEEGRVSEGREGREGGSPLAV